MIREIILEYHTKIGRDKDPTETEFIRQCERVLPRAIPRGLTLTVVLWRDIGDRELDRVAASELIHTRYILTDRGGYFLSEGLDESEPPGAQKQTWSLVSEKLRKQEFGWYDWPHSPVFQHVTSVKIEGKR